MPGWADSPRADEDEPRAAIRRDQDRGEWGKGEFPWGTFGNVWAFEREENGQD